MNEATDKIVEYQHKHNVIRLEEYKSIFGELSRIPIRDLSLLRPQDKQKQWVVQTSSER